MNSILQILCFCAFLHCIVPHFNVSCANAIHFFTLCADKTKMLLTVFHCHTVPNENVCGLLCKSMLPNMFIKMCVKLKQIHLASYLEVEKLTSKVNASL